ncbi:hypothetical protein [Escherichia coli]|uniref:hypothetical protein n=1 Tax=Escherichia coli TaxID=562 RepID=UPI000CFAD64D|nr:hypothetical protein [Escherichia coli]
MMKRTMTDKEREIALQLAREKREQQKREWAALAEAGKIRQHFADANHWARLRSQYGITSPYKLAPAESDHGMKILRRTIRLTGGFEWFNESFGMDIKQFVRMNPTWSAYAIQGVILEEWDDYQN